MDLIYWSVRLSNRREGDGVKGLDEGYRYFSQREVSHMNLNKNMEQHPSTYIIWKD